MEFSHPQEVRNVYASLQLRPAHPQENVPVAERKFLHIEHFPSHVSRGASAAALRQAASFWPMPDSLTHTYTKRIGLRGIYCIYRFSIVLSRLFILHNLDHSLFLIRSTLYILPSLRRNIPAF